MGARTSGERVGAGIGRNKGGGLGPTGKGDEIG